MKDVIKSTCLLFKNRFCKPALGILCFLLLVVYPQTLLAQSIPKGMAKVDTQVLKIGAPLTYQLTVEADKGTKLEWPAFQDSLGAFEILDQQPVDTSGKGAKQTLKQTFTLTCFEPDRQAIPSVSIPYELKDGNEGVIKTDSFSIRVETVKVDSANQIKPLKGLLEIPLTFREILPYILGGVGVLILAGIAYWLFRRWKRKKEQPAKTSERLQLPHEKALANLQALEEQQLWQRGYIKEYHDQLTDIIRDYLERILQIQAMEVTTSEILEALQDKPLPKSQIDQLRELFTKADMAKFAKAQPSANENERALTVAYAFIKETWGSANERDE